MSSVPAADAIRDLVTGAVDSIFAAHDVEILPYAATTPNSADVPDPDRPFVTLPLIIRSVAVESGRGASDWKVIDARRAGHGSTRTIAFVATSALVGKDVRAGDRFVAPDGKTYRITGPIRPNTTRTMLPLEMV